MSINTKYNQEVQMKSKLKLITAITLAFVASVFAGESYSVDAAHSRIGFKVAHMVVSKTHGQFDQFSVKVNYDPKNITASSVVAEIDAKSINTDNEKRDNHLRASDFLEVATYPKISFKSTKIEKTKDGFLAHGLFTLRGVTKEIKLPFELKGPIMDPYGKSRIGAEASLKINRKDYGVSFNAAMETGGLVVGDTVEILIDIELIKD
jgi:polyisoprenoid-binding protein YceI